MHIHPGRTAAAFVMLAELGAALGSVLGFLFFIGWPLMHGFELDGRNLLGAVYGGMFLGVPIGGLVAPALGFTLLRRIPIGRAIAFALVGAACGCMAALLLPVPMIGPAGLLTLTGTLAGALVARLRGGRSLPSSAAAGVAMPNDA